MVSSKVSKGVKSFYADILGQAFSPCGNYLAVTTVYGEICLFDLKTALNPPDEDTGNSQRPVLTFPVLNSIGAFSLLTTQKFLIVGSLTKIFGYEWKGLIAGKTPKVSWSWEIPSERQNIEGVEINCLGVGTGAGSLYAGCGDNKIHMFSMEDGRLVRSLTGHEGYIHDLRIINPNEMVTASEDGTVKFWDLRTSRFTSQIEPWKEVQLERPSLGKWVGSIFIDKEWLLCGGGVKAGLWNIPTMQLTTPFITEDSGIHACMMHEERVIVGDRYKISEFSLLGDPICSVASSSATQLSFAFQEQPFRVLSISGNSACIDLCTNFDYRDQTLTLS